MNVQKKGTFVISLDFELYWGMIDKVTLEEYGDRIVGVRKAIPAILALFDEYEIHATWATLGMLMYERKQELLSALPDEPMRPDYGNPALSSYEHIKNFDIKENEQEDPYHFGSSLVHSITETPDQEIASHTFSHYYSIEGINNDESIFDADCKAMNAAAAKHGIVPTSIVFPRNQAVQKAFSTAKQNGIFVYRGTEQHPIYKPRRDDTQSLLIRALRLADHYINLTGDHTYDISTTPDSDVLINVPASRFLRPYSRTLRFLEPLRMRRIKNAMTHAAKHGEAFHLWWHPHNFGIDTEKNIENLKTILEHYKTLSETYGMRSMTMSEVANQRMGT